MKNVLLSKDYNGFKAGKLLKGIAPKEAETIKRLGLGDILPDDKPEEKGAKKDKVQE